MTGGAPTPRALTLRAAGPPRTPKHPREEIVESPRIARLRRELGDGEAGALERFWADVTASGTPLVEDGEAGRHTLTFLWRDRHGSGEGTSRVVLIANRLTDPTALEDSVLHRVGGTDVWHRSYRLASSFRSTYLLAPDDGHAQEPSSWTGAAARWRDHVATVWLDPLNTDSFPERNGKSRASVAALPDAPADDGLRPRPGVEPGTLGEHHVDSAVLGTSRRVWVHVPASVAEARAAQQPSGAAPALLVLFDGDDWVGRLDGPALLDNLVAAERVPPVVTLMPDAIGPRERAADLAPGAPFARFVRDELLPWAAETFGATADPARTFVAGQSLGGLAALALALEHPARFAGVVAQSASLWWAPPASEPRERSGACWAIDRCAAAPLDGLRVHLEVGSLEWVLLEDYRRLREALARAGARVAYAEFAGGHEALCWRAGLGDALAGVLSAGA